MVQKLLDIRVQIVDEKKELLATLITQHQDLVQEKLSSIQRLLGKDITLEQLGKKMSSRQEFDGLFKEISGGLDIKEVLERQQQFKFAEFLYFAATTHGPAYKEYYTACPDGTWSQILQATTDIHPKFLDDYGTLKDKEKQKNEINKDIAGEFITVLSSTLVKYVENNPLLQDALLEFAMGGVDITKPNDITPSQQKILTKINQIFSEKKADLLLNYTRDRPTEPEYRTIITGLNDNNNTLVDFAVNHEKAMTPEEKQRLDLESEKQGSYNKTNIPEHIKEFEKKQKLLKLLENKNDTIINKEFPVSPKQENKNNIIINKELPVSPKQENKGDIILNKDYHNALLDIKLKLNNIQKLATLPKQSGERSKSLPTKPSQRLL